MINQKLYCPLFSLSLQEKEREKKKTGTKGGFLWFVKITYFSITYGIVCIYV